MNKLWYNLIYHTSMQCIINLVLLFIYFINLLNYIPYLLAIIINFFIMNIHTYNIIFIIYQKIYILKIQLLI